MFLVLLFALVYQQLIFSLPLTLPQSELDIHHLAEQIPLMNDCGHR
jgi:hypothetical protein